MVTVAKELFGLRASGANDDEQIQFGDRLPARLGIKKHNPGIRCIKSLEEVRAKGIF
jgi:hypothetical protein